MGTSPFTSEDTRPLVSDKLPIAKGSVTYVLDKLRLPYHPLRDRSKSCNVSCYSTALLGLMHTPHKSNPCDFSYNATINAALYLHRRVLERIMRATFRFYDITPSGRIVSILGRFLAKPLS
jgi:hypothetical protein